MTDYVAHRRLTLILSPGVALLAAGVVLHVSGWRLSAWPPLVVGTVATALFLGNLFEFLRLRRWRRRRCPACGSPYRVEFLTDIGFSARYDLSDGVCRHSLHYDLTCKSCGTKSRFDGAGRFVGPSDEGNEA
jgi:hypothetical protein